MTDIAASRPLPVPRPRRPWRSASLVLVVPGVIFFVAMLLGPLARSFLMSTGLGEPDFPSIDSYVRMFGQEFYLRVLLRTLRISVLVVLLTALAGYPVAYRLTQLGTVARRYLYIALLAPLLVSHAVISFGWLVILSQNGLVDSSLLSLGVISEPLRLLFTETAIVIGLVHIFLPYMTVSIAASMNNIDNRVVLAARNLGASPWAAFRRIVFPLTLPGLFAGSTIVFSLSMSAFATPAFLGGTRSRVMSSLAYQQAMQVLDWRFAAAISFVLLAVSCLVLALSNRMFERGHYSVVFR